MNRLKITLFISFLLVCGLTLFTAIISNVNGVKAAGQVWQVSTPTLTPTPTWVPPMPTNTPNGLPVTVTPYPPYPTGDGNRTAENIILEGHWGGAPGAVVVNGDYLYAGTGPELAVFDRSNPTDVFKVGNFSLIGETQPHDNVEAVTVLGNYVYVVDGKHVRILDVSDPTQPIALGLYESAGQPQGLAVSGNYLYLADGTEGLRIIDISNPANPVEVAFFFSQNPAQNVVISNNIAYLVDRYRLYALDISDPVHPIGLGYFTSSQYLYDLVIGGDYVYLNRRYSGLQIVDVSNPANITEIAVYPTSTELQSLAQQGNYLYLAERYEGLRALDITDPSNPLEAGYWPQAILSAGLVVSGNYVYLADYNEGWYVIDVSNPAVPVEANLIPNLSYANFMAQQGDYAYVVGNRKLYIVDVTNPNGPEFSAVFTTTGNLNRLAVANNYVYLTADDQSLRILDVSDPVNPLEISTFDTPDYASDVAVVGDYAYLVDPPNGMYILDVSDPALPVQMGVYTQTLGSLRIAVGHDVLDENDYAYLIGDNDNLQAVDVTDPTGPFLEQELPVYMPVSAIEFANNRLYLVTIYGNLKIYIITPYDRVSFAGEYVQQFPVYDLAIVDNYVYLALSYGVGGGKQKASAGPQSEPSIEMATVLSSTSQTELAYYNRGGILAVDVADPFQPAGTGYFATGGSAISVAAQTDYVYAVDDDKGFFVLQKIPGIIGQVTDINGLPFAGVVLTTDTGLTTTTRYNSGAYTFNPAPGNYVITPSLNGYVFEPPSRSVSIPPDANNQNFIIKPAPVSLTLQPHSAASLIFSDTLGLITRLDFPAGVVTTSTTIILSMGDAVTPTGRLQYAQRNFRLEAYQTGGGGSVALDLVFNKPVTMSVSYRDADILYENHEERLGLWYQWQASWENVTDACAYNAPFVYHRDMQNNRLIAPICKTGVLGLFWVSPLERGATIGSVRDSATGSASFTLNKANELGLPVLLPLAWSSFEPLAGAYNWAELDDILNQLWFHNNEVIFRVYRAPEWARPAGSGITAPPTDSQALYNFMNALVSHINQHYPWLTHSIEGYVIWNEPNIPLEWGNQPINAQDYVTLLQAGYEGAKAADPGVKIISAGLAPTATENGAINDLTYLQQLYDANFIAYLDYIGFNGLGFQYDPDADSGNPDYNFKRLKYLHDVMLANGDTTHPVWALEVGWLRESAYDMGDFEPFKVSAQAQAEYLYRAQQKADYDWPWLERIVFWNLDFYRYYPPTSSFYWYSLANNNLAERYLGYYGPVITYLFPDQDGYIEHCDVKGVEKRISFNTGSVDKPTTLQLLPFQAGGPAGWLAVGDGFELKTYQQHGSLNLNMPFSQPVEVSLFYDQYLADPIIDENDLTLFWWNGTAWQDAAQICQPASSYQRDIDYNSLTVEVCRSGRYLLAGPTHPVYLPLILRE